jgi:hypothetical protein
VPQLLNKGFGALEGNFGMLVCDVSDMALNACRTFWSLELTFSSSPFRLIWRRLENPRIPLNHDRSRDRSRRIPAPQTHTGMIRNFSADACLVIYPGLPQSAQFALLDPHLTFRRVFIKALMVMFRCGILSRPSRMTRVMRMMSSICVIRIKVCASQSFAFLTYSLS